MKIFTYHILTIVISYLFTASVIAKSHYQNFRWDNLSKLDIQEKQQGIEIDQKVKNLKFLKEAKYFLISGNINKAENRLVRVSNIGSSWKIRDRYLAIVYYLKGEFQKSLNLLSGDDKRTSSYLNQTCLLKALNAIALRDKKDMRIDFSLCKIYLEKHSQTEVFWPDYIMQIYFQDNYYLDGEPIRKVTKFMHTNELLKIWLKLALLFKKEGLVKKELPFIPAEAYEQDKVRELMALVFYRLGKIKEALKYIEDISTPNAENLKGTFYLKKKQYEVAYGHFQLALKQKRNSSIAIERSLPLSWILKEYENGHTLSQQIKPKSGENYLEKMALTSAFLVKLNLHKDAKKSLLQLNGHYNQNIPVEVSQLNYVNAIMLKDRNRAARYTRKACEKYDAVACQTQLFLALWPDFTKAIHLDEDIISEDKKVSWDKLIGQKQTFSLQESVYIDQENIEEMDEALIKIRPDQSDFDVKEEL